MLSHNCPTCSSPLSLVDLPKIGEQVICQTCESSYEVVWLFPLELVLVKALSNQKAGKIPE